MAAETGKFKVGDYVRFIGTPERIWDGSHTRLVTGKAHVVLADHWENHPGIVKISKDEDQIEWWVDGNTELEKWTPKPNDPVEYFNGGNRFWVAPGWVGQKGFVLKLDDTDRYRPTAKIRFYNDHSDHTVSQCNLKPILDGTPPVRAKQKPKAPLELKWGRKLNLWKIS